MADLARIARPWLFSLRQQPLRASRIPSPYLGLGYSRSISATACRSFTRPIKKDRRQMVKQITPESTFLLPYTVVPPPVWRFPLNPIKFTQMVWFLAKNRLVSLGAVLGVYMISMAKPTRGYRWPVFRTRKRAAVPTAKALHVQMSEAVAAGDKETLRRVCTTELFQTLAGAIDARPRNVRAEWELVRYEDKLVYPRLADFRVSYQAGSAKLVKQAVVSISSVQRLTRYDDARGGEVVPGSGRDRHMTEHIVLQAEIHDKTYAAGPWKIWGTLSEMSYEDMCEERAMFDEVMAEQTRMRRQ
ncbi:hypothetical protein F5Y09DRAFT_303804 [Xylaria sp. FL1042]|nr:hypothetical protein F5Y09DRAFT_303804 [Xylaria sp. FL1042]